VIVNLIRNCLSVFDSHNWSPARGSAITAILALCLLSILEFHSPKYFLQNDNLDYTLPDFSYNLSALEQGSLAEYEFFQFTGIPHLSSGQSATLYPPATFAVWLGKRLSGRLDVAIDIYAAMHLLFGAVFSFLLLIQVGIRPGVAVWGALTWIFCPFVMILGRTWVPVVVWAAWFPTILYLILRFSRRPGLASMALLALARTAFCYSGHSQFLLLTFLFEALAVLLALSLARPKLNMRLGILYVSGWALTCLLSLPFLLPVSHQVALSHLRAEPLSLEEMSSLGMNIGSFIWGHLLPFYTIGAPGGAAMVQTVLYISHISWPALLGVLLGLRQLILKRGKNRLILAFCLLMAAVAYSWSTNLLLNLFSHLPVLNRFRWSFKLQFFTSFFMIVMAATVFSISANSLWRRLLYAATFANFLWVYLYLPARAWGLHPPQPIVNPYPQIDTNFRTMTLGYPVLNAPALPGLGYGYSLLFQLPHLSGYEPLASKDRFVIAGNEAHLGSFNSLPDESDWAHFENWAVRFFVVSELRKDIQAAMTARGFQQLARSQGSILFENPSARPLGILLPEGQLSQPVPVQIQANRLNIESPGGLLRLAFVQDPFHFVSIDGVPAEFVSKPGLPIELKIPSGQRHKVQIEYSNPLFRKGLVWASLGSLSLFLLLWLMNLKDAEPLDL
jgi:hypothetical protein